jgi:hypothetical protein
MEVVEEFFDFTIDIWRVIVRHLYRDERSTMRLLWVSSKSRKGVLTCFEWWMHMYPLRFIAFREIKKQAVVVGDFPFFCLHFTIEAHIHNVTTRLTKLRRYLPVLEGKRLGPTKLKKRQEQREKDLTEIAKTEQKLLRPNPVICPVKLSKTVNKSLVAKAVKELRYYANLRFIHWCENESGAYFQGMKDKDKEQKKENKRQKREKEDSDLDYVE